MHEITSLLIHMRLMTYADKFNGHILNITFTRTTNSLFERKTPRTLSLFTFLIAHETGVHSTPVPSPVSIHFIIFHFVVFSLIYVSLNILD